MPGKKNAKKVFQKTVFNNGLTLVTERQPEFRSLSIGAWIKAGTRHERPRENGISHFLEHMLFKGTETRSALQIAQEVDRVGGEFNAFTAREYTCLHFLLLDRDLSLGMDVLSDIVLNSTFDPQELERERKVILQEIAMVEESPEELVHDLFFEFIYGRHGLGRPILGTETSVRRLRRGDLLRYLKKHYCPENMVISVAGDVSHESVRRRMAALTRTSWNGSRLPVIAAPPIRPGCWWVNRPTEQVHLVWGVEGPRYASRDRFAALLLNLYLGGGMSSSLFQEIREKRGLAYTVYSSMSPFLDSGVFSIYAATAVHQVALCLKLIEECVGRLKTQLLSEEELQTVKDNFKGTVLLSADSVESRMSSIANNQIFFGKYLSVDEICRRIDEVRPEDVRRLARKLVGHGHRSILALGPRPPRQIIAKMQPEFLKR